MRPQSSKIFTPDCLLATRDQRKFWFCLLSVQFDSAVWYTPRSQIIRRNRKRTRQHCSLFVRSPGGLEYGKSIGKQSRATLPLEGARLWGGWVVSGEAACWTWAAGPPSATSWPPAAGQITSTWPTCSRATGSTQPSLGSNPWCGGIGCTKARPERRYIVKVCPYYFWKVLNYSSILNFVQFFILS